MPWRFKHTCHWNVDCDITYLTNVLYLAMTTNEFSSNETVAQMIELSFQLVKQSTGDLLTQTCVTMPWYDILCWYTDSISYWYRKFIYSVRYFDMPLEGCLQCKFLQFSTSYSKNNLLWNEFCKYVSINFQSTIESQVTLGHFISYETVKRN